MVARAHAAECLGEDGAVLVLDDTGFVPRCGRAGGAG